MYICEEVASNYERNVDCRVLMKLAYNLGDD